MKPKYSSFSLWVILLTALVLLFSEPAYTSFMDMGWVKNIQTSFRPSLFSDICALVALVVGCLIIDNAMDKAEEKTAERIIGLSVIVLPLFIVLRLKHGESYVSLSLLPFFKYGDIPSLAMFMLLIKSLFVFNKDEVSQREAIKGSSDSNLLFDDNEAADILGRNESVTKVSKLLEKEINKYGSFGIAVTGGWGSGKSWYMTSLERELKGNGQICLTFKPWLYGEKELTLRFCKLLESTFIESDYDTQSIKNLSNDLLKEAGGYGRLASFLLSLNSHDTRDNLVERVKDEMSYLNKQIFVFMDDCDRLTKNELLQVFSLIRNVCDFPNLCYILSYDPDIIRKTLRSEGGLAYVSKMVDLSVPLEPISNVLIIDRLCQHFNVKINNENIRERLSRVDFTSYLHTIRDLKRYWNLLYNDYILQKEIFEKAFLSESDWLILELIKYKDSKLYSKIKYNPQEILETNNVGWNAPAWKYDKKTNGNSIKSCESLVEFLFGNESGSSSEDSLFGVASKTWHRVYFSTKLPSGMRDFNEYAQCLNNGTFQNKIEEWTRSKDVGLLYIIAASYKNMNNVDSLKCLVNYIWTSCDISEAKNTINSLVSGYPKSDIPHSYRHIKRFLSVNPLIQDVFFQIFQPFDKDKLEEQFLDFIKGTNRVLETTALIMQQIRDEDDSNSGDYIQAHWYIPFLWNRILERGFKDDIDILNIFEIWHDCTLEDTFDKLILPCIKNNPERWLSATIKILRVSDDEEYLLLKSRELHALFGSEAESLNLLYRLESEADESYKPFIEEYKSLYKTLSSIILYMNGHTITEDYRTPSALQKSNFPLLSQTHRIGMDAAMPLRAALSQLSNTSFWKGESLRIKREGKEIYIKQDF